MSCSGAAVTGGTAGPGETALADGAGEGGSLVHPCLPPHLNSRKIAPLKILLQIWLTVTKNHL